MNEWSMFHLSHTSAPGPGGVAWEHSLDSDSEHLFVTQQQQQQKTYICNQKITIHYNICCADQETCIAINVDRYHAGHIVLVLPYPWEMKCAVSPSSFLRMRFSQRTVSPSSLLRDSVYKMCSGPLILPERWVLPSVQWGPHPSWQMRFTQCAVGPSSLLTDEVYPVCSGPLLPPERWGLPSVQ